MSNESTIQREMRKSKREKERVRDPPSLRDGIPWDKEQRQERDLQEGKTSQRASPLKSVIVQRRMLLITGIHLRVHFHQWRNGNLGISVRFGMRNKAGGEPKKRTNSVVVAKTLEKSLR